jgi:hypothetical protein
MTKEIESINLIIEKSAEYGLVAEVVWSALLAIQKDPKLSVTEAIHSGHWEWCK